MIRTFTPWQGSDNIMAVPYSPGWIADSQLTIYQMEVVKQREYRNVLDNLANGNARKMAEQVSVVRSLW